MSQFIQNYPSKSKPKQTEYLKEVKKYVTIEKSKIEMANRKAQETERLKLEAQKSKAPSKKQKRHKVKVEKPFVEGSRVKIKNTKQAGDVLKIEGNQVTVAFGNLKAKVSIEKLTVI